MTSEERRERRYQRRKADRELRRLIRSDGRDDFEAVFSYEHLYASYLKCRLGVSWKSSVQRFKARAPYEIYQIYRQLHEGTWKSRGFYEFDIVERGKLRHIRSVDMAERVVQRCLCDYALIPMIAPTFIFDNGATMKDKGYHFSINRCAHHLVEHVRKYGLNGYVLTFDFSKFFDNVSHEVIFDLVDRMFTDERIKDLVHTLVDAFGDKGLGLGSQVSQIFALASANKLDHVIKEELQIKAYGRYMDDGYLISESKEVLERALARIREVCNELHIKLNSKKTQIIKLTRGFTFLKCRFCLTASGHLIRRLCRKSTTKTRRKLKALRRKLDEGTIGFPDAYQSFQSWRAYAKHFDAFRSIRSIERIFNDLFVFMPDLG